MHDGELVFERAKVVFVCSPDTQIISSRNFVIRLPLLFVSYQSLGNCLTINLNSLYME